MAEEINRRRYIKELPVDLTTEEKLAKMATVLALEVEQGDLTEEARDTAQEFKGQIADLQKQIDALKRQLRTGKEPRQIEVEEAKDWAHKMIRTHRLDTGEVVTERAMRQDELQTAFPDGEYDPVT